MSSFSNSARIVLALAVVAVAPTVARAQQSAPPPAGVPAAPRTRRTVEIRAQAPAPEVITVRPREVPPYTRRLLVPALLAYPDSTGALRASVVVPAPASAEARAAASPDRRIRTP